MSAAQNEPGAGPMSADQPRPYPSFWPLSYDDCPDRPHRGPEGPNEDISQCGKCGCPSYSMRPPNETFGSHLPDCSLPVEHASYCVGGGNGHPKAEVERG